MSWQPANDPNAEAGPCPALEIVVVPRTRDLGDGFEVRRVLPSVKRRMVGPFVFFDQMGPIAFTGGRRLDVRPHPHIGLATVTYLFEGEIMHRDSIGTVQSILPGAVNWMTAGRGIAHSERSPTPPGADAGRLFGIQSWVALPKRHEETAPSFTHQTPAELPVIEGEGVRLRVIAGALYSMRSPTPTFSDMFYADAMLDAGARLNFPAEHEERAAYIVTGDIELAGERFAAGQLLVFRPGDAIPIRAAGAARLLLLGGEPMDGPRHLWWNFVSSSNERIEQAKADWQAGRFGAVIGDTAEFIPLPA
jgi:redox-sensitive bicupin YhaK (pirin superfamily)